MINFHENEMIALALILSVKLRTVVSGHKQIEKHMRSSYRRSSADFGLNIAEDTDME